MKSTLPLTLCTDNIKKCSPNGAALFPIRSCANVTQATDAATHRDSDTDTETDSSALGIGRFLAFDMTFGLPFEVRSLKAVIIHQWTTTPTAIMDLPG